MVFTHDTEVALAAAAALVNTDQNGGLTTVAELDAFVDAEGWTGSRAHTDAELAAVQDLRPRLREVWTADEDRVVAIVNGLLRDPQDDVTAAALAERQGRALAAERSSTLTAMPAAGVDLVAGDAHAGCAAVGVRPSASRSSGRVRTRSSA